MRPSKVRFSEPAGQATSRPARPQQPAPMPALRDRPARAARAGLEACTAIRDAIANPTPGTVMDHDLEHAVRMTKLAAWHAWSHLGRRRPGSPGRAANERRRR